MMDKLNKIMQERASQYGSFETNMRNVMRLKKKIKVFIEVDRLIQYDTLFLENSIEFIKNMLALKAARSITAKGEAYEDCVNDFLNYIRLFEDTFKASLRFDAPFNIHLNKSCKEREVLVSNLIN